MNLITREIDSDTIGNIEYLERWQDKYGSLYHKLLKCTCINCNESVKEYDSLNYVACYNGKIVMWHLSCQN